VQVERGFQGFWRSAGSREIERRGMFVPLKKKKKEKRISDRTSSSAADALYRHLLTWVYVLHTAQLS
jgi:hypothetical protein